MKHRNKINKTEKKQKRCYECPQREKKQDKTVFLKIMAEMDGY